jgi:hypothetical protein
MIHQKICIRSYIIGFVRQSFNIGKSAIYDDYIKSEQLKVYFDELGLTKDLLSGTSD